MAYTAPPTFTTGNVLTAAQMNTNVRDNPNFLHDPPGCLVSRTTNQSFASGTAVSQLTLGTVIYDTDSITGGVDLGINTAGIYHMSLNVEWAAQSGGSRVATITDMTLNQSVATSLTAPAGTAAGNSCAGDYKCVAGGSPTTIAGQVWQNSGSTVAVLGTSTSSVINISANANCYLGVHWVGAG